MGQEVGYHFPREDHRSRDIRGDFADYGFRRGSRCVFKIEGFLYAGHSHHGIDMTEAVQELGDLIGEGGYVRDVHLLNLQSWELFLQCLEALEAATCGYDCFALGVEATRKA